LRIRVAAGVAARLEMAPGLSGQAANLCDQVAAPCLAAFRLLTKSRMRESSSRLACMTACAWSFAREPRRHRSAAPGFRVHDSDRPWRVMPAMRAPAFQGVQLPLQLGEPAVCPGDLCSKHSARPLRGLEQLGRPLRCRYWRSRDRILPRGAGPLRRLLAPGPLRFFCHRRSRNEARAPSPRRWYHWPAAGPSMASTFGLPDRAGRLSRGRLIGGKNPVVFVEVR